MIINVRPIPLLTIIILSALFACSHNKKSVKPPSEFKIAEATLAKGIYNSENDSIPLSPSNTFTTHDSEIFSYVRFINLPGKHHFRWDWINPKGDLYLSTREHTVTSSKDRYIKEGVILHKISIKGEKAQYYPGEWTVNIYMDDQMISSNEFEIVPFDQTLTKQNKIVVAVTNFRNLIEKEEYEWLSIGISELFNTFLNKISRTKIVERSDLNKILKEQSLMLTGAISDNAAPQIGKLAGATNIIVGSYQIMDDKITINTRMMKTETGEILRAEMMSGDLSELNYLVETLVLKMCGAVGYKLSSAEKIIIAQQGKKMMKIIEALSMGKLSSYEGDLDEAKKYYKEALLKDPTNKEVLKQIKDIDSKLKSIGIVTFKNNSKIAGYDYLSSSIPESFTTLMTHKTALAFTERLNIEKALNEMKIGTIGIVDEKTAPKLGKLAGASQLLIGSYEVLDDNIKINARFIDTETGRIIIGDEESGKLSNIYEVEEILCDKLIFKLGKVRVVTKKIIDSSKEKTTKAHKKVEQMKKQLSEELNQIELVLEESLVGFEFGSVQLKKSSQLVLNDVADVLKQFPKYRIVIIGHTDIIGSSEYNQTLSEKRAKSVLNYMTKRGLKSNRLTSIGFGKGKPIDTNDTKEGRAKNRRVEFMLIRK